MLFIVFLLSVISLSECQNAIDDDSYWMDTRGIRDRFISGAFRGKNSWCNGTRDNVSYSGVCTDFKSCLIQGGRNFGSCSIFGACCVISKTCSARSSLKVVYFTTPTNIDTLDSCSMEVTIQNRNVCQVRLDFEEFTLSRPDLATDAGNCLNDSFDITVSNQDTTNLGIPPLCGTNTGQHLYVPVDARSGSVTLSLNFRFASQGTNPTWRIRATQLECATNSLDFSSVQSTLTTLYQRHKNKKHNTVARDSDLLAPDGCRQYFPEPSGVIESFAFPDHYPPNLDYTICFRRIPGTCGIRFTVNTFRLPPCLTAATLTDYLFIPRVFPDNNLGYLCSEFTPGTNVISRAISGPLNINFFSDGTSRPADATGFSIQYQLLTSCSQL